MSARLFSVAFTACVLTALPAAAADPTFRFEERTLDPNAGDVVYAVTPADVDGDGKSDVVAVTEDQVLWYRNPDWTKGVILDGGTARDNVCIAPHDVDGDGRIDFALGAGWPQAGGTIQWLGRDPGGEDWKVRFIGAIPSTHRMRWADVLGTGKQQLVVSPLNGTDGEGAKLTAFEVPANPKTDRWPATVIADGLNRLHNHWCVTQDDGSTPVGTYVASQEGVRLVMKSQWKPNVIVDDRIAEGATGEIKVGVTRDARRLVATIEPMHGTHAVVYVSPAPMAFLATPMPPERHVLDDTLGRGHALWLADLDGDGGDEVIVGHSDPATGPVKGPGVYVYEAADAGGSKWTKHVVDDGGMATEDLFALDLTGDGRPDLVAGGRNTHNVKLYVNVGE